MVRVALVGCAHIHTPRFADTLRDRPDVEVPLVWDADPARARRYAEDLGAAVASDPAAAWSDGGVAAAVICAETVRHRDLVLAGAAAGKHLFVEKPLGTTGADATTMARAVADAGVRFQTGYFLRSNPAHRFVRDQLRAGAFGDLLRLRYTNAHSGLTRGIFADEYRWMTDPAQAGFGAFGDLGAHALDLLLWLRDEAPVAAVAATLREMPGRLGGTDVAGEGTVRFTDGVTATVAASWVDAANPLTLEVAGTDGHAHVAGGDLYFSSTHVDGADGTRPWADLPPALPHAFDLFLDVVGGDTAADLVDVRAAARRTTVMETLYAAAHAGRWVEVREGA